MTKKQKTAALLGRMAAAPALFLLMLGAGSLTAYAAGYDLYIGSTQVTDANAGDIFGDGTASYDAGTKTLTLNGVHIGADNYYEVKGTLDDSTTDHYSMYAGEDVVRHLVINGDNSFVSAGSEKVYCYEAKVTDDWGFTVDSNADGIINAEDMTPIRSYPAGSGIHFTATGSGADNAFTITGTGTLTSTATEGYCHDYDNTNGEFLGGDGYRRAENTGTALTIAGGGWVQMGEAVYKDADDPTTVGIIEKKLEKCIGPTLKLTGWDVGADFKANEFNMEGGTIIAKAESPTYGTGVYLNGNNDWFQGGTIAGYGTYNGDEYQPEGGAFSGGSVFHLNTTPSKENGMQRVYPNPPVSEYEDENEEHPTQIRGISGWGVAGMTADGFKAQTDAVLAELSLDPSGGGEEPGTDPDNPGGGGGTDPTNPDTPDTPSTGEGNSYHTDAVPDSGVEIDVQGFTKAKTVYSVDVEWGAMTFQYEKSSWDAENHTTKPGRGWLVYDSVNDAVVDGTQDAINCITVTNHSNASVFATLSYTGNDSYEDITGDFTKKADDTVTKFTGKAAATPAYLTLDSADNNAGEGEGVGKETVGKAYFLPTTAVANDISSWAKIGKITVGLLTEEP